MMGSRVQGALLAGVAGLCFTSGAASAQDVPWTHMLFGLPGDFSSVAEVRFYDSFGELGPTGLGFNAGDGSDDLDVDVDGLSFMAGTGFKALSDQDFGIFVSGIIASGDDSVGGFFRYQGPFFNETLLSGLDADFDLQLYAVDAEYGQAVALGPNTAMRLFTGVRAAYLDLDRDFSGPGFSSGDLDSKVDNYYFGLGPRAGAEVAYDLGAGFGLSALAAGSLLAGKKHSALDYSGSFQVAREHEDEFGLVPVAESEVGLTYAHTLGPFSAVYATIGYRAEYWFDIVNDAELADGLPDENDDRDLGFSGPFFRATISW